jgi:hypothetical protein
MRKKSSYFFSAKKLLEMYGIFAQLRKTVLVLFVNLHLGLSARVSQLTIQNTYYTYLYCLYVLYTIHEMARFGIQGAIQYTFICI